MQRNQKPCWWIGPSHWCLLGICAASLLAMASLSGCRSSSPSVGGSSSSSGANEIHGEFIAALKRRHWADPDAFEMCVLGPQTTLYGDYDGDEGWERFRERLPSIRRDTYDSYWTNNEEPRPVAPTGSIPMRVHVLTEAEIAELEEVSRGDDDGYWESFHERFENAVLVHLSMPGVSRDGQQAVIYYRASFGSLAAWGGYCLLSRETGRWVIAEEKVLWEA